MRQRHLNKERNFFGGESVLCIEEIFLSSSMDGRPRPTSGCPSVLRLPDVHKESETPSTSGEGERKFTESSSKVTGMRRLNLTQQNTKIQKDTKKKEAEASLRKITVRTYQLLPHNVQQLRSSCWYIPHTKTRPAAGTSWRNISFHQNVLRTCQRRSLL